MSKKMIAQIAGIALAVDVLGVGIALLIRRTARSVPLVGGIVDAVTGVGANGGSVAGVTTLSSD